MKSSRSFRWLIRTLGVVGLCGGLLLVFIGIAFIITKTPRMDRELIMIGGAISAISLYFVCGAPHLVRAVERRHDHDTTA